MPEVSARRYSPEGYGGAAVPRKKPPYTGVLAEPFDTREGPAGLLNRWIALCAHYGVDHTHEHSGYDLAMALASAHVPGFQPAAAAAKGGRPKSNPVTAVKLVLHVMRLEEKVGSIGRACELLSERHPSYKGMKPSTLRSRFYAATKDKDVMATMNHLSCQKLPQAEATASAVEKLYH
jgi:hypothetical protein